MAGIAIERIETRNAALLDRVADEVFDHRIDPSRVRMLAMAVGHAMFVAVDGDRVVGQARGMVHLQPDKAPDLYVDNLGIAPSHRRRGIATRLLEALRHWGRAQGCEIVWVCTEADNDGARGFYTAQALAGDKIAYFEGPLSPPRDEQE